jgi:glycosyltransferase involved in cell wall biosynthesis
MIGTMQIETIVLVHPFLLHYHFARLQALSEACLQVGISMHSLELTSYSDQYRSLCENRETTFNNRVLFRERSLESLSTREMWPPLREELTTLKPDVVFIYGYSLGIMRQIRFWAERNGVGVVMISDSNEFDKTRYRPFELLKSLFISRVDAAFVGGTNSSLYLQKLGLPKERIVTGYDVVDSQAFSRRTEENRRVRAQVQKRWGLPDDCFLFVGRIIKEKNLKRLLDAYGRYAELVGSEIAPWGLVICGSGPEEEGLRQSVERMPRQLRDRIQFCGLIRQPEIVDFYSCASCLVLPSTSESWGLVVNEALACNLPLLVSRQAGCAADLVEEGVTGWLFDPYDIDQLAHLMTDMHRMDSRTRAEMGEQGRRLIAGWGLQKFSQGALESARIASSYRCRRHSHRIGSSSNRSGGA